MKRTNKKPDRRLELTAISSLKPYQRNARVHSEEQIAQVMASIKEFGWTNPVLVDDKGGIIAGHARVEAAKRLGYTEVPTIRLSGLTEAQARAYIIADNKLALNAGWDEGLLALELADLKALDFDLGLTGFDAKELASLLQPAIEAESNTDDGNSVPAISKKGDLFALGRHRLLCGDSSDIHQVERILDGITPDLLLYDPPYEVAESWTWAYPCERALIFTDYQHIREAWGIAQGYSSTMQFIWDYGTSQFTHSRPLQQHRSCLYCSSDARWMPDRAIYSDGKERVAYKRGTTRWGNYQYNPLPSGCRYLSTVYTEGYQNAVYGKNLHGKPVNWIRCLIGGSGAKTVLDMFCGSGTSLIAAPEDVSVFAIEIDERKVDEILARWERYARAEVRLITGDTRVPADPLATAGDRAIAVH
jgi:hypothetical protein